MKKIKSFFKVLLIVAIAVVGVALAQDIHSKQQFIKEDAKQLEESTNEDEFWNKRLAEMKWKAEKGVEANLELRNAFQALEEAEERYNKAKDRYEAVITMMDGADYKLFIEYAVAQGVRSEEELAKLDAM